MCMPCDNWPKNEQYKDLDNKNLYSIFAFAPGIKPLEWNIVCTIAGDQSWELLTFLVHKYLNFLGAQW